MRGVHKYITFTFPNPLYTLQLLNLSKTAGAEHKTAKNIIQIRTGPTFAGMTADSFRTFR
jgi:hypothetical protein